MAIAIKVGIALVFLAPLIVMGKPLPNSYFPFIVGKAIYIRSLAEITFAMWAVLAIRNPSYRPPRSWLLPLLGVYVAVTLIASLYGVSSQRSLWSTYERMQGFVDLLHWLLLVIVLVSVFRSWADWRALLNFNLAVSAAMGLLGLTQRFEFGVLSYLKATPRLEITLGNPTYVGAYMMVGVLVAAAFLAHSLVPREQAAPPRAQGRRRRRSRKEVAGPGGPTAEGMTLAAVQIAILLTLLALFVTGSSGAFVLLVLELVAFGASYLFWPRPRYAWWRVFWLTVLVLDLAIMYLSGTRGALIGLIAGVLAFGLGYALWGQLPRVRVSTIALMFVLLVLSTALVSVRNTGWFEDLARHNNMLYRISIVGDANDSLRGRLDSAITGLRGFKARPLLGWGPENFAIAYDRLVTPEIVAVGVTSFDQAHSKPIEELTTKGIFGFASYMALWLFILWVLVRRVRWLGPGEQLFVLLASAALVGYFVQNIFLFDTPGTVPNFYLLLGFMVFVDTGTAGPPVSAAMSEDRPRRRPWTGLVQTKALQSEAAFGAALAAAGLLVLVSLFFLSYRPYHAASSVLHALRRDTPWSERLDLFDESIRAFRPLANYFRLEMFRHIALDWSEMSEEERSAALAATSAEGVDAITGEPEEWRLYFMQALVFQQAAARSPEYVARSRELVDTAIGLAPMRVEVNRLLVRQAIVERDMGSAQEALDFYLALNPNAARHFMEMVAVLMRQYIAQGDLADAQGALDSYLKLDPVSAPSFSELALDLVRRYISEQDFTRAQTALEGYLALNPAAAAAFQVSRDEIESAIKTQSAAGE